MKAIESQLRCVANVHSSAFKPFVVSEGMTDGEVLQVNGGKLGFGFHVYRMSPGQTTTQHKHIGDEEFLLIEGDLVDHDGYEYKPGDLVCLRSGTEHTSYSEQGCMLAVYLPAAEGF